MIAKSFDAIGALQFRLLGNEEGDISFFQAGDIPFQKVISYQIEIFLSATLQVFADDIGFRVECDSVSCMFFPMLGLLCILRYTIQGVGFTNLAMFSGVAEMIARILVSLYAVPAFGFLAVCYGDPMAWIAADLFLVPAFIYVYRRLRRQVLTNSF